MNGGDLGRGTECWREVRVGGRLLLKSVWSIFSRDGGGRSRPDVVFIQCDVAVGCAVVVARGAAEVCMFNSVAVAADL
jgi:hypothetical protein